MKGAVQTIPISRFGIVTVTNLGWAVTVNRQERNWSGIRLAGITRKAKQRAESRANESIQQINQHSQLSDYDHGISVARHGHLHHAIHGYRQYAGTG